MILFLIEKVFLLIGTKAGTKTMLNKNMLLLVIRLSIGTIFTLHGCQKVLGWFKGPGLSGWLNFMKSMQVPTLLAYASAFFEFLGGIMLIVGFMPEIGALMTACVMMGAIYLVHLPHGFFIQDGGYEYSLLLLILSLLIVMFGAGQWYIWDPFINLRI